MKEPNSKPGGEATSDLRWNIDWQRRQKLLHVLVWLLLAAAVLAAWLPLLREALAQPATLQSSGDALLDDYSASAIDNWLHNGGQSWAEGIVITKADLDQLKSAHPDDSRVMELEYQLLTTNYYFDSPSVGEDFAERRLRFLQEHSTPALQLQLVVYELQQWRGEAFSGLKIARAPGTNASLEQQKQHDAKLYGYIRAQHGAEMDNDFARLRDLLPDEALPCYRQAFLLAREGRLSEAWDWLRTGNRQPSCRLISLFPVGELHALILAGEEPSDPILGASFSKFDSNLASATGLSVGRGLDYLIDDAVKRRSLADLQELHTYCCRIGRAGGMRRGGSANAAQVIEKLAHTHLATLNPQAARNRALLELQALSSSLVSNVSSSSSKAAAGGNKAGSSASLLDSAIELLKVSLSSAEQLNASYAEDVNWRRAIQQRGPLYQQFERLEGFDYRTLSWSPETMPRADELQAVGP